MMFLVIGFKKLDYNNKAGKHIKGVLFFLTDLERASLNEYGYCPERFYISDSELNRMKFYDYVDEHLINQSIKISFNRYGKVVSIELAD